MAGENLEDGTYELCGPKVQGNPEDLAHHVLLRHGNFAWERQPPRDRAGVRDFLEERPGVEGIVWHHPDGRMAKIKRTDLGLAR